MDAGRLIRKHDRVERASQVAGLDIRVVQRWCTRSRTVPAASASSLRPCSASKLWYRPMRGRCDLLPAGALRSQSAKSPVAGSRQTGSPRCHSAIDRLPGIGVGSRSSRPAGSRQDACHSTGAATGCVHGVHLARPSAAAAYAPSHRTAAWADRRDTAAGRDNAAAPAAPSHNCCTAAACGSTCAAVGVALDLHLPERQRLQQLPGRARDRAARPESRMPQGDVRAICRCPIL